MTTATMVADVMRHFQARQHVGRAVVVCAEPDSVLATANKQWLRLSRDLQQRRGAATNAVEILKYTYTITQMQQLRLTADAPHEQPDADLYVVRPEQLRLVPADGMTVYLMCDVAGDRLTALTKELPAEALVVDYCSQIVPTKTPLQHKSVLEQAVRTKWRQAEYYLLAYHVDMRTLEDPARRTEAMDDVIDELLEDDQEFLGLARLFQRTLDLARPLRTITKAERSRYELFMLLAHRVQTLSAGGFSAQFLGTYADDMFYLSDNHRPDETVAEAALRHQAAGRRRLARALLRSGTQAWRGEVRAGAQTGVRGPAQAGAHLLAGV